MSLIIALLILHFFSTCSRVGTGLWLRPSPSVGSPLQGAPGPASRLSVKRSSTTLSSTHCLLFTSVLVSYAFVTTLFLYVPPVSVVASPNLALLYLNLPWRVWIIETLESFSKLKRKGLRNRLSLLWWMRYDIWPLISLILDHSRVNHKRS